MLIKHIKAFTLAEMLVTMALTSLLAGFCYLGYTNIQRMLGQQSRQNSFITTLNVFTTRTGRLMQSCNRAILEQDRKLIFYCDSVKTSLQFGENNILMSRFGRTDTFYLKPGGLQLGYEPLQNAAWQNRLVNRLELDVYYQEQSFHLDFRKMYDALTKLGLEKEN